MTALKQTIEKLEQSLTEFGELQAKYNKILNELIREMKELKKYA